MSTVSRRETLGLIGGAAVLPLIPGPALAKTKIKVGALRFTSHAPSFVALERGYFADAGLDVEFKELRRNASFLTQHLVIRIVALVFLTIIISFLFKMPIQPAVLMGLALGYHSQSVAITPGHTAFTRIPAVAYSSAAVRVSPTMPCFDAT